MLRIVQKLNAIRMAHENVFDIPILIIGETYREYGLEIPSGEAASDWANVVRIGTTVWGSAWSTAYALSALGFNPAVVAAIPKRDPIRQLINGELTAQILRWQTDWNLKIGYKPIALEGDCPTRIVLPRNTGAYYFVDPGCLRELRWEHVLKHKGDLPGVLVINAFFLTALHENLKKVLSKQFSDWLICLEFGRLDRRAQSINDVMVTTLKDCRGLIDIHITSQRDLTEWLHEELRSGPASNLDHDTKLALNWLGKEGPQALLVKTHGQDRKLLCRDGQSFLAEEHQYWGANPGVSTQWSPRFGGVVNGVLLGSALKRCFDAQSTGGGRTPNEMREIFGAAADDGLVGLCYCTEQFAGKAMCGHIAFDNDDARPHVKQASGVLSFPLESLLAACRAQEGVSLERRTPLEYISTHGWLPGLLGFRGCRDVFDKIKQACDCDEPVLITGESGTGKEEVARYIASRSRPGKPFCATNLASLGALIESELFGHVPGAFTGATTERVGIFEHADGGTILLDDIDCLPMGTQEKLLRIVDGKPFRKLGSNKNIETDVRLIAATNANLKYMVGNKFREDLYYRLDQISIHLPPLRERPHEIPVLAMHFLKEFQKEKGKKEVDWPDIDFGPDVLRMLMNLAWKDGSARGLRACVRLAAVNCKGRSAGGGQLPLEIQWADIPEKYREQSQLLGDVDAGTWKKLRAAERVFVKFWPEIRKILQDSMLNEAIDWNEAARKIEGGHTIPLTDVQVYRHLKELVEKIVKAKHVSIGRILKLAPQQFAEAFASLHARSNARGPDEMRGE